MDAVIETTLATLCLLNLAVSALVIRYVRRVLAIPEANLDSWLGRTVQPFEVDDVAGNRMTASELTSGSAVLVLLSSDCAACLRLADDLLMEEDLARQPTLVIVQSDMADPPIANRLHKGNVRTVVDGPRGSALNCLGEVNAFPTVLELLEGEVVGAHHQLLTRSPIGDKR